MSTQILNGNELIIQGALEAGFSLYTGYPGSPLADYFNILYKRKSEFQEKGIKVAIANSEANAAAMASGAKQAGRDCIVAMKSMGLHVASDALSVGNFANPGLSTISAESGEAVKAGTVIVVGDDPWSISTSTPADSRYLFKHLHIPFLEPSTPQELKDWMKVALGLSQRTSVYQGVILSTYMAEGGGRVEVGLPKEVKKEKENLDPSQFDLSQNVMVPPNSLGADVRMINERFPKIERELEKLALDITFGKKESDVGIISSGVIFETLKQVLEEGELLDEVSLYKCACSYPLVSNILVPWLKSKKTIIVVEEKRGFLESELRELINKNNLSVNVLGKDFKVGEKTMSGFPAHGGLSFELIRDGLVRALEALNFENKIKESLCHQVCTWDEALPKRLPTFCPGCPHRETLSLLKDLRKILKEEDIDLISHGDVGCYSLSFLPPFKEMHNLSAMGQGGALGAGLDMFSENPSVVLMGDSTFFHSGITDISNSVQCGHQITYILLDNDNTAMTGHQMTPASGVSVEGEARPRQNMLNAVESLGVDLAFEVNPSDRYFYKNKLIETVRKPGIKVIVSNKECALTFQGRLKAKERKDFAQGKVLSKKSFYQINTDACEDCRVCVESTGCPGLTQTFDAYGSKVTIDPQICVSDSYCTKMKACPSFELVDVINYHPTKYKNSDKLDINEKNLALPNITKSFDSIANGDDLRVVVTGVGGSGVTTISNVLAQAATEMNGREDLSFKFVDQKGLAQRNGNVTSHLSIFNKEKSYGAVTPSGTADLLLSPDLLDGSTHIRFIKSEGLCLFDNDFQIPLSIMLDNAVEKKTLSRTELLRKLELKVGENLRTFGLKKLSLHYLGKSVYASAMLLGVAWQSGKLPFTLDNMKDAFKKTMKKEELDNNLMAFTIGRYLIENGEESITPRNKLSEEEKVDIVRQSLKDSFLPWQSTKEIFKLFNSNLNTLDKYFPEVKKHYLAQYLHDIYIYNRGARVDDFISKAGEISQLFSKSYEHKRMALRTLAKTYFVKDEVFVSHQMISPIKKMRDSKAYKNLGTKFRVNHINRPKFDILGMSLEFDVSPRPWMFRIMRYMRVLRLFLVKWHSKEREISSKIREKMIDDISKLPEEKRYHELKKLENIKGYREVRYESATKYGL
ncbi:thiamine pyrophosphate-dependent enzyme [Bacteriovoracaceae bacterium]|nr:thiamine pyrophosphate-dependent enzyme [Bacteriovoracaceae bacterium]